MRGILQGDSLSVILFILIIPLKKDKRTQNQECNRSHNASFFVDDLKTYANEGKKHLDIITTLSKDINMNFGLDKCAYMYVERGKRKYRNKNQGTEGR